MRSMIPNVVTRHCVDVPFNCDKLANTLVYDYIHSELPKA